MTSREKVRAIFERRNSGRTGFWTGNPHADTYKMYIEALGCGDAEGLFRTLNDDCRWIAADGGYRPPDGGGMFDPLGGAPRTSLNQPGLLADAETVADVEKYPWPDPAHLHFEGVLEKVRKHPNEAVFTGGWSPFYHFIADLFGMDNYFLGMLERPEVIDAATEHVLSFCEELNERYFAVLGDGADIFFFGNDFGTQLDLLISPELFDRFVLPGMRRLIAVAKRNGKKVLLHSCGSIYKAIPRLIDAGIDGLHPIQALAANMDAATLAREFKRDICFVGGIDTQQLLVLGTPQQIKDDVRRVRDLLGPNLVVSPSHEAILPNVPLANVVAMSEAALDG